MNKLTALFMLTLAFVSSVIYVSATDTSNFQVTILGDPEPVISVQVPDTIFLGETRAGEQTTDARVDINNTGNVAITVTPRLASGANDIFTNLYFRRITSEPYYKIGDYRHNISAPADGGVKSSYMYVKLDLREYPDNFAVGSVNRINSDVKFLAVAQ